MSILQSILIKASGSRFIQNLLEKNVQKSQYLMGIGSGGGGVFSSGERAIFRLLKQRCKPPYCIFDVGSNKGQFLKLILDSIPLADCAIHCFEPGRETFKILGESSRKDQRIKLNNLGISKEKGEMSLHYDRVGSTLASLTKRKLDHFGIDFSKTEKVEINTLDDYCAENAIGHIDLLKIDIEGHELDALQGAKKLFEAKAIAIVTFEFGGCNIDTRTFFQDFWYFFRERDFKIFRITPSGYLAPIESYQEILEQFRTINFIAVANR